MDGQTIVALAGIASGTLLTPIVTALFARRMFAVQHTADQESADLVEARRIVMEFAASIVEFRDATRQYGRELERAATLDGGAITEALRFTRRHLDDRVYYLDLGAGTFWHMVGNESGVAVSHRALIERAQSIARLAVKIEESEHIDAVALTEWRREANMASVEFDRFAAAVGSMVGFRLPGAWPGR